MKSAELTALKETILPKLLSVGDPQKIILFGSRASQEYRVDSDVDILLIEPSSLPRYQRSTRYRRALKELRLAKDIVVWTPEEINEWQHVPSAFITTIIREGITLYEK